MCVFIQHFIFVKIHVEAGCASLMGENTTIFELTLFSPLDGADVLLKDHPVDSTEYTA